MSRCAEDQDPCPKGLIQAQINCRSQINCRRRFRRRGKPTKIRCRTSAAETSVIEQQQIKPGHAPSHGEKREGVHAAHHLAKKGNVARIDVKCSEPVSWPA